MSHPQLAVTLLSVSALCTALVLLASLRVSARRAIRWPLLAVNVAAVVLLGMVANAGQTRLDHVKAVGSAAEIAAAQAHAKGSSALAGAIALLLIVVLAGFSVLGRRSRVRSWWERMITWALALSAVGIVAAAIYTATAAMHAASLR